jgi:hypothetical protein
MKMSDCEMQRLDKPPKSNAFWNAYPAGFHAKIQAKLTVNDIDSSIGAVEL